MEMKSPISDFISVLKSVQQTARLHDVKLKKSEAATRAALVDPILYSLGWDLTNPDMVEFEKPYDRTRLDYALLNSSSHVVTIIEAKALGGDLTSNTVIAQILSYGFTYSLHNIILTDGITWHHYSDATPGSYKPESIDLSQDSLITCADFFIKKLDASRYWFQPNPPATVPVSQSTPSVTMVSPNASIPKAISSTSTSTSTKYQVLTDLPKELTNMASPKLLRLPDGQVKTIYHWRDILVECVKFVLQENSLIPVPLPDKAGKKISLLSHQKPDRKVAVMQTTYNGKMLYVHLNYDSSNCVANAIHILGFLPKGKPWETVEVAF